MSDSYPPKHNGWLAGYKPTPRPTATPTASYPGVFPTTASSGYDVHVKLPACAQKIGDAALYPRYGGAVAAASLPYQETLDTWKLYPVVFLL